MPAVQAQQALCTRLDADLREIGLTTLRYAALASLQKLRRTVSDSIVIFGSLISKTVMTSLLGSA